MRCFNLMQGRKTPPTINCPWRRDNHSKPKHGLSQEANLFRKMGRIHFCQLIASNFAYSRTFLILVKTSTMKSFLFCVLVISCSLFSCSGSSADKMLQGKWKVKTETWHDHESDVSENYLELMPSGSFTKENHGETKDGKWYLVSGKNRADEDVTFLVLEYPDEDKTDLFKIKSDDENHLTIGLD